MAYSSKANVVQLYSTDANRSIHKLEVGAPVWSCCWQSGTNGQFFVGLADGCINLYDSRMLVGQNSAAEPILEVTGAASPVPVANLHWIESTFSAARCPSGLLVGRLNQCSLHQSLMPNEFSTHILPIEGQIASLSYDKQCNLFMVTLRPSITHPVITHEVCRFYCRNAPSPYDPLANDWLYSCKVIQRINSGFVQPQLTKNVLFWEPQVRTCLAGTFNRSIKCVSIREASFAELKTSIQSSDTLQIDYCVVDNKTFLTVLTN